MKTLSHQETNTIAGGSFDVAKILTKVQGSVSLGCRMGIQNYLHDLKNNSKVDYDPSGCNVNDTLLIIEKLVDSYDFKDLVS